MNPAETFRGRFARRAVKVIDLYNHPAFANKNVIPTIIKARRVQNRARVRIVEIPELLIVKIISIAGLPIHLHLLTD